MKKIFIVVGILIILAIIAFFVFKKDSIEPYVPMDNSGATTENVASVVGANNKFALDLYSLYQSEDGNLFFSPYSISSALAMTYEGARGLTAEQMQSVFYFPEDEDRRLGNASLYNLFNEQGKSYELNIANAIWIEKKFSFLDSFLDIITNYYGGAIEKMDFIKNPDGSRIIINNWVEERTNNKIKDLIPGGMIDSLTRAVLTNAIYFKGDWVKEFNKEDTAELPFYVEEQEPIYVEMMRKLDEPEFNYMENNSLQMIELPYSGEELSMLILLPKEDSLETLEDKLSFNKLNGWKNSLRKREVNVLIPKFKFESKYFMANDLSILGMPVAFSDQADFSGMSVQEGLTIDEVIHQAFVEVNEQGTEAAAATAVVMEAMSAGPSIGPKILVFKADHPFIFIIQHNATGNILFMGRVNDPSVE